MAHKLKREGGELSASFDYFHYYRVGNQLMDSFKPDTLKGDMKGNTDLYVGQIDAVYPLSEVWKLQAGVKTSFVTIDNTAGICVRRFPAGCRTGHLVPDSYMMRISMPLIYKSAMRKTA